MLNIVNKVVSVFTDSTTDLSEADSSQTEVITNIINIYIDDASRNTQNGVLQFILDLNVFFKRVEIIWLWWMDYWNNQLI